MNEEELNAELVALGYSDPSKVEIRGKVLVDSLLANCGLRECLRLQEEMCKKYVARVSDLEAELYKVSRVVDAARNQKVVIFSEVATTEQQRAATQELIDAVDALDSPRALN